MSQLNIQILHQNYVLTCPEGQESQLLEAVERVDQQFESIRDSNKLRSRERVGVVLAVNLAYENLELRKQLQALQQELAAAQGPALSDADAERLQALEQQAQQDQATALALQARLDEVLLNAQPVAISSESIEPETIALQDAATEVTDTSVSPDGESDMHTQQTQVATHTVF